MARDFAPGKEDFQETGKERMIPIHFLCRFSQPAGFLSMQPVRVEILSWTTRWILGLSKNTNRCCMFDFVQLWTFSSYMMVGSLNI